MLTEVCMGCGESTPKTKIYLRLCLPCRGKGERIEYVPSPQQIQLGTEVLRAAWDEREERRRRVGLVNRQIRFEFPTMSATPGR